MAGAASLGSQRATDREPDGEDRYGALVAHLRSGVARFAAADAVDDARGFVLVDANPAFLAAVGPAAIVGAPLGAILPGHTVDDLQRYATYARVVRTGEPARIEVYVAARDRWAAIVAFRSAPGELTLIVDDLTPRLRAEAAARHSADLFAAAYHGNAAAMAIARDHDRRLVSCNAQYLALTGLAHDDVIGRTPVELGHVTAEEMAAVTAALARPGGRGGATPFETTLRLRSGEAKTVLVSLDWIDVAGEGRCTLSTFTDITARSRAERRLATQQACSRILTQPGERDDVLARLLEARCRGDAWDGGAVWIADRDGQPPRLCAAWPSPGDVAAAELARDVLDQRAAIVRALPGAGEAPRWAIGAPIWCGDLVVGALVVRAPRAEFADAAARDALDSLACELGLYIDRLRALAALRQLNGELEQRVLARTAELAASNRELEAFSYTVSHDLRAPLRAINGFAEILLDEHRAALADEPIRMLSRIRDSGKRLGAMIDDLLAFARLGRAALRPRVVDVEPMVRDVVGELTRATTGVRVHVARLAPCFADPSLLRLVWLNLIDNAIKYSRGRDPALIHITCDATEDVIAYRVRDNGVGFDPQYADRLFGVFQRLHTATEFAGTGVGLASVRRIVERHGGCVSARAVLDQGSTFSFTLPAPPRAAPSP
jgi:PAS domain S-box-containing protein